jgi:hypothetical protein
VDKFDFDLLPRGSEPFGFTLGEGITAQHCRAMAHYVVGKRGPMITKVIIEVMDRWSLRSEEIEISKLFSTTQLAIIENMIAAKLQLCDTPYRLPSGGMICL